MIAAIRWAASKARSQRRMSLALPNARRNRNATANFAVSAFRPMSKPAALRRRALRAASGARGGLYESATVRVHPTGQVTVLIGTHNHGQGHETTFAQIVSEKLGVAFDNVDIVFGDTDRVQFGMGTYGSRSLRRRRRGAGQGQREGGREGQEDCRASA